MKLERLLTITNILINHKRITAQDLATMFDVSVRTIYRDIDILSQAGIPVVTFQGSNGGIGLMDGYRIDQQVLTKDELSAITNALKSVLTSYEDHQTNSALEKLQVINAETPQLGPILIDFSPWGESTLLKTKVTLLKKAIESAVCVKFSYSTSSGVTSSREIEPHLIILKGKAWYIYGYCLLREQFRLFKLNRMKDVVVTEAAFTKKEINLDHAPWEQEWYHSSQTVTITLTFAPDYRTVIEEMFDVESIFVHESGQHYVKTEMPEDEWLYGFLLSFLDKIEVVEPLHIREKLQEYTSRIYQLYPVSTGSKTTASNLREIREV